MAENNIPEEQPYLHRTMNIGQWRDGVKKFRETNNNVTVWEDREYLFEVVGKDGQPHARCFWKLGNRELYCHPANIETLELPEPIRQT